MLLPVLSNFNLMHLTSKTSIRSGRMLKIANSNTVITTAAKFIVESTQKLEVEIFSQTFSLTTEKNLVQTTLFLKLKTQK